MNVIPKELPKVEKGDKTFPVVIWMVNKDIIAIAHHKGTLSLKDAKSLQKVAYEMNEFRHSHVLFSLNRAYSGEAVYSKEGRLKILIGPKGSLYRM